MEDDKLLTTIIIGLAMVFCIIIGSILIVEVVKLTGFEQIVKIFVSGVFIFGWILLITIIGFNIYKKLP